MTKIIQINLFIIYFFVSIHLIAQEAVLMDLQMNPIVSKRWVELTNTNSTAKLARSVQLSLSLPFHDDFSMESVYPDASKWVDKSVFINRTYPKSPISIGVATFDGIDSTGYPYNFAASAISSAEADRLSSLPIDLGTFFLPDSLYFSFFYQAQGRGNAPEAKDSLVLQFKRPSTNTWQNMWARKGHTPSVLDTNFHLVMIPLIDTAFLKNNFQFRFKNYATLSGNVDHWHIDYVYLNNNRNIADTIFEDVAFVYDPPSLLKRYYAMPWEQYQPSELKDSITTLTTVIRNSNKVTKNTFYNYSIMNGAGTTLSSYGGGSANIDPYYPSGHCNYAPFSTPPLNYKIPSLSDSALFIWESYLKSIPDFNNNNDTVRIYQKFYNYYAYDDGTAEAGYGLSGTNPKMAIRYSLNVPDTLKAIQMYFNPIISNSTVHSFRLAVWNDNGGLPGAIIYKDSVVKPFYDKGTNAFHTYRLSNQTLFLPAGTYYFGWLQTTSDLLNVGFDLNTNSINNTLISVSGTWQQSNFKGSVMLRPVFGEPFEIASIAKQKLLAYNFEVFPNPAQDILNITIHDRSDPRRIHLSMINTYGQTVLSEVNFSATSIDVSELPQGLYFLKITDQYANSLIKRVAIVR